MSTQNITCTSTSWVGDSLQQGSVPPVQVGDTFIVDLTTRPSGYSITVNGDGTFQIAAGGDASRQSFGYSVLRAATNTTDGPATVWINEVGAVWGPAAKIPNLPTGVALALNLAAPLLSPIYATSPEGDTLVFSVSSGSLPIGVTLSSAGILSGVPYGSAAAYQFLLNATDSSGLPVQSPLFEMDVVVPTPAPAPSVTNNLPNKAPPSKRIIDIRSLAYGISGPEQPYPVYQFSGNRVRWEYPQHNPFASEGGFVFGESGFGNEGF